MNGTHSVGTLGVSTLDLLYFDCGFHGSHSGLLGGPLQDTTFSCDSTEGNDKIHSVPFFVGV